MTRPPVPARRAELLSIGTTDATLARERRRGDLLSIVPGSYVTREDWAALDGLARHRLRVLETAARLKTQPVYSHFAAAALLGIRILNEWPERIDVTLERSSGGRSGGLLRRRCTGLDDVDVVSLDGLLVTSPAQTVTDLARELPFADGVVAMDSALHRKRRPRPLLTVDELDARVAASAGKPGHRRAVACARFATPLSDSPQESHSRVQIHLLGFPEPELQSRLLLPDGSTAELDFRWPQYDHGGECDGRAKYRNPEFLRGRTPTEAVIDEKNRENQVRRVVSRLSRWEPAHLYPPARLYDLLTADGLPSSKPRPPRTTRWT
ncbi:MAG: hypothetical protein ABWY53_01315 [Leifsonia flava]